MSELLPENGKVKIRGVKTAVQTASLPNFDPRTWLAKQTASYQYLLAHTLDGVIWGVYGDGHWHLSGDLQSPPSPDLNRDNLLELRLFSSQAEIYIWREDGQFIARTIQDGAEKPTGEYEAYDEPQMLWGTTGKLVGDRFVRLEDGSEGLGHLVPLPGLGNFGRGNERPVRLSIRHYIEQDKEAGLARVTMSRLFDLTFEFKEEQHGAPA